jgi:hypothetical protein
MQRCLTGEVGGRPPSGDSGLAGPEGRVALHGDTGGEPNELRHGIPILRVNRHHHVLVIETVERIVDATGYGSTRVLWKLPYDECSDIEGGIDRFIDGLGSVVVEVTNSSSQSGVDARDSSLHVGATGGEAFAASCLERFGTCLFKEISGGIVDKLKSATPECGRSGGDTGVANDPIQ